MRRPLAGMPADQAFDAINNEDDLMKVIIANPSAINLAALSETAERDADGGDFKPAFLRAAAEAYASLA